VDFAPIDGHGLSVTWSWTQRPVMESLVRAVGDYDTALGVDGVDGGVA
jgi:hypothetical protein